jgi:hypothetical protein
VRESSHDCIVTILPDALTLLALLRPLMVSFSWHVWRLPAAFSAQ